MCGCDYISKIGTKHAAILAKPKENLCSFAECAILDNDQIDEAEKYLVKVMKQFLANLLHEISHRVKSGI